LLDARFAARSRRVAAALILAMAASAAQSQDTEVRPPFVTTPEEVVERMLGLAGTRADDFVIDLGSGDGRIVIAAARKFGARGLGVDIDSRLVALSRENSRRAGVDALARFEERDVLATDLSQATVVTIYLLPWLVDRLQPKLLHELSPGTRIVAHAFPMKGWKPDRSERLRVARPERGQSGEATLFLWIVPADARGFWRAGNWGLRIHQNFQEIEVEPIPEAGSLAVAEAKLEGRAISFSGPEFTFRGRVEGGEIRGEITRSGRADKIVFRRD
jgi:precorrin-6B methylase 2